MDAPTIPPALAEAERHLDDVATQIERLDAEMLERPPGVSAAAVRHRLKHQHDRLARYVATLRGAGEALA